MLIAPTGWEIVSTGIHSNGARSVILEDKDYQIKIPYIPAPSWFERWRGITIETKMQGFIDRAVALSNRMEPELEIQ